MGISKKRGWFAFVFLLLAGMVGAGFWLWSWWQRKKAPFVCPVVWQYCRKAKPVHLPNGSPAIGFVVPEGTEVLAGVSGLAKQSGYRREDGKVEQAVRIKTKDGSRLSYAFIGRAFVQMQEVAQGQPIGRIEDKGEAIKGAGVNLVVYFLNQEGKAEAVSHRDFRRLK